MRLVTGVVIISLTLLPQSAKKEEEMRLVTQHDITSSCHAADFVRVSSYDKCVHVRATDPCMIVLPAYMDADDREMLSRRAKELGMTCVRE